MKGQRPRPSLRPAPYDRAQLIGGRPPPCRVAGSAAPSEKSILRPAQRVMLPRAAQPPSRPGGRALAAVDDTVNTPGNSTTLNVRGWSRAPLASPGMRGDDASRLALVESLMDSVDVQARLADAQADELASTSVRKRSG